MPNRKEPHEKFDHHITVSFTKAQYERIMASGRANGDSSKGAAVRRLMERAFRLDDSTDDD